MLSGNKPVLSDQEYPDPIRIHPNDMRSIHSRLIRKGKTRLLSLLALITIAVVAIATDHKSLLINDVEYHIELAVTAQQRQIGLMHREKLGPREGMLLVYPEAGDRRIWMKNVPIPLRVYWIADDFTVIEYKRLPPCEYSPCPVYSANGQSRYVLELGDFPHPIKAGDRIEGLSNL